MGRCLHRPSVLAAVVAALLVSACGGDDGSAATTTAAPTTQAATTAGQPATTANADVTAITAAFLTFFDGKDTNLDKKVALLENGEKYRSMLADAMADAQYKQLSTTIRSVKLLTGADCTALGTTSPCALVVHDMLVGGFPAVAAHESPAVYAGGTWKVGAKAWCDFVAIGGETCPA